MKIKHLPAGIAGDCPVAEVEIERYCPRKLTCSGQRFSEACTRVVEKL
jgi:hypothetical protein